MGRLRDDGVEALARQQQCVACVVDVNAQARIGQGVAPAPLPDGTVGRHDLLFELHHLDPLDRRRNVLHRDSSPQTDDQHRTRLRASQDWQRAKPTGGHPTGVPGPGRIDVRLGQAVGAQLPVVRIGEQEHGRCPPHGVELDRASSGWLAHRRRRHDAPRCSGRLQDHQHHPGDGDAGDRQRPLAEEKRREHGQQQVERHAAGKRAAEAQRGYQHEAGCERTDNGAQGIGGVDPRGGGAGVLGAACENADGQREGGADTERRRKEREHGGRGVAPALRQARYAEAAGEVRDGIDTRVGRQREPRDAELGESEAQRRTLSAGGEPRCHGRADGDADQKGREHRRERVHAAPHDVGEQPGPQDLVAEGDRAREEDQQQDRVQTVAGLRSAACGGRQRR